MRYYVGVRNRLYETKGFSQISEALAARWLAVQESGLNADQVAIVEADDATEALKKIIDWYKGVK